jgi:hypothetical protein
MFGIRIRFLWIWMQPKTSMWTGSRVPNECGSMGPVRPLCNRVLVILSLDASTFINLFLVQGEIYMLYYRKNTGKYVNFVKIKDPRSGSRF